MLLLLLLLLLLCSVWRGHGPGLPHGALPSTLQQPGIQQPSVRQRRQDIPRQVSGLRLWSVLLACLWWLPVTTVGT
jgi:hypothetical protein